MMTARTPSSPARRMSLPIGVWLVLGFAFVIGAFVAASAVALRSTRGATDDLARMQQQFEPLTRSVRELGVGLATFDRVVLAYLRADTPGNRIAAAESAERVSRAANRTLETGAGKSPPVGPVLERIARHQAEGFRLLDMQDERRRSIATRGRAVAASRRAPLPARATTTSASG